MNQAKLDLRIGELLIESGALSPSELEQAMKTTESTGLPVGRVLIMAGYLNEIEFQAAVQAQSLVRDSIVPLPVAVKALQYVFDQGMLFEEALKASGFEQTEDPHQSNKLGELLLGSGVVPSENLDTAMRTSQATGLPLGRLLVSLGLLSDELLSTALNAQTLIRSAQITREQALEGLQAARERRRPVEQPLAELGYYRGPHRLSIRLGELLRQAQLINDEQTAEAIMKGIVECKAFGAVLVEQNIITPALLDQALQVQEMLANETLSGKQAIETLEQMHQGKPLAAALSQLQVPVEDFKTRVRYIDVLKVAGLIHPSEQRFNDSKPDRPDSADALATANVLLQEGLIDERMYTGSLRCYFLIAIGWLNMQQGIIALNYFHHKDRSFDDVLHELKWAVRTHRRTDEEQRLLGDGAAIAQKTQETAR